MDLQYPITKVAERHRGLITDMFTEKLGLLQKSDKKLIYRYIDISVVVRNVMEAEHAYIVGGYLVVFDIDATWFTDELVLHEALIYMLAKGYDFAVVDHFLTTKAREAGARYIVAGTALARRDAALASLYTKHGYTQGAIALMKEV